MDLVTERIVLASLLGGWGVGAAFLPLGGMIHFLLILALIVFLAGRFGRPAGRPRLEPGHVVDFLLAEASWGPELWNQFSYLSRVVAVAPDRGIVDEGIVPLALFVDTPGPDAVAVAVETDDTGDIHPAVYVRRGGSVEEHLLPSERLHRFESPEHRRMLEAVLSGLVG